MVVEVLDAETQPCHAHVADRRQFLFAQRARFAFEGDFFGLYRDAYYGDNIDIYNGMAPVGAEIAGKKGLAGLKVAFGPQLWWGANPAVFVKYQRKVGGIDWTAMFQEDDDAALRDWVIARAIANDKGAMVALT